MNEKAGNRLSDLYNRFYHGRWVRHFPNTFRPCIQELHERQTTQETQTISRDKLIYYTYLLHTCDKLLLLIIVVHCY